MYNISDDKDYKELYLKYKKKYLDLKNGTGGGFVAPRKSTSSKSSSKSSSYSSRPYGSVSTISPNPYNTKFGKIDDNENNYKISEKICNKECSNIPDRKCTPEEIIKTYEYLKYDQFKKIYNDYVIKYPELLSRINNLASEWAEFIKKEVNENKSCKSKILASLRCDNFNNFKSARGDSSKEKLMEKYNAKSKSFFNGKNLNPNLFIEFSLVVTSPDYEQYIQNPSKLIIQSRLPFKPTENKDADIMTLYNNFYDYGRQGFINIRDY